MPKLNESKLTAIKEAVKRALLMSPDLLDDQDPSMDTYFYDDEFMTNELTPFCMELTDEEIFVKSFDEFDIPLDPAQRLDDEYTLKPQYVRKYFYAKEWIKGAKFVRDYGK